MTGAGGFIGKNTCIFLSKTGHKVIPLLRSVSQAGALNEKYETVVACDLSKSYSLEAAKKSKPDIVVHLAAKLPTSFFGGEVKRIADINRKIDDNILHFCRNIGVGALYASTCSVYGRDEGEIKVESSKCHPLGDYAEEKLYGERLGEELLEREGLQFTSLRINAPYGPGQRTRTVLNIFVERAIEGSPLLYHGSGTRQQDFTYVKDIAEAIFHAIERGKSGVFNISGGEPVTMKQLGELVVRSVNGCQSVIQASGEEDPQEGSTALFSIEKAKSELGWVPRTSLESGVKEFVMHKMAEKQ
ncbi:MAG: NAD-dependent epimerase/dehydratase family protein [Candidatus Hodarchaeota archaeon]